MDFPFPDFDAFLEDDLLGPLLFPHSAPRASLHPTLVPRFQLHARRSLLSPQASMPDPPFLFGRSSAHHRNHAHARLTPSRNNRAAAHFNSSRAGFSPNLPTLPNGSSTAAPDRLQLSPPGIHAPAPRRQARLPPPLNPPQTGNSTLQPRSGARAIQLSHARPIPPFQEPNSDDFLNELVSGNFSSPSLPPQRPRSPVDSTLSSLRSHPLTEHARGGLAWGTSPLSISAAGLDDINPKREKSATPISPCTQVSGHAKMPSSRRGARGGASNSDPAVEVTDVRPTQIRSGHRPSSLNQPSRKRKLGEVAQARAVEQKTASLDSDDSPFADSKDTSVEVIDLADTEDVPDLGSLATKKHQVQLKGFQCVICMDDTTNLTVTHCGHLFCGECLHSSLQIDSNKKICPICRQKIDLRPAAPNTSANTRAKAKTFYPLRMKLMTAKRRGKQAVH